MLKIFKEFDDYWLERLREFTQKAACPGAEDFSATGGLDGVLLELECRKQFTLDRGR